MLDQGGQEGDKQEPTTNTPCRHCSVRNDSLAVATKKKR
jgi:hypothetical protein